VSKTMFTPGPWEVASDFIGPLHVRPVGQPWSVAHVGHEDFDICEANARLIAAAPDLYEALAPVLRGANEADYYCPDDVADDHTVLVSFTVAELRAARAALAKAHPILSPHDLSEQKGEV